MMLDTVGVVVSPEHIEAMPTWEELFLRKRELKLQRRYSTLQVSSGRNGNLKLSLSVPQVLLGTSLEEIGEQQMGGMEELFTSLIESLGVILRNPHSLRLFRVDMCANLETPLPACEYINHAARFQGTSGPIYRAGQSTTLIRGIYLSLALYDKIRQASRGKRTRGGKILRVELQMKSTGTVKSILGIVTLEELVALGPESIFAALSVQMRKMLGRVGAISCTSPSGAWDLAIAEKRRVSAPRAAFIFLASRNGGLSALDVSALESMYFTKLSRNAAYGERRFLRSLINSTDLGRSFERDVLDALDARAGRKRMAEEAG
jgi:hypothetical protein